MTVPFQVVAREGVPFVVQAPGAVPLAQAAAAAGMAVAAAEDAARSAAALMPLLPIELASTGVNQFDPAAVNIGKEISFETGAAIDSATSAISGLIEVVGWTAVTVSGLAATTFDRFFVWLAADRSTIVAFDYVDKAAGAFTRARPDGAAFFRFDVYRRQVDYGSPAGIQVQKGTAATPFEPFRIDKVVSLGGKAFAAPPAEDRWAGKRYGLFGDSITQTERPDQNKTSYGSAAARRNWVDAFFAEMRPASLHNYALAGAHIASLGVLDPFQKLHRQIDQAIADGRSFDVVIISMLTNDIGSHFDPSINLDLGSYASAMAVDYNGLVETISMQAFRKALYRITQQWPDAVIGWMTPLQRAAFTPEIMRPIIDDFARMAGRYGCDVIDQFASSGVVADFEILDGVGRDLLDGLHPMLSGMLKQARLACAWAKARLA